MTTSIYTMTNRKALRTDFNAMVAEAVQTMYADVVDIRDELERSYNKVHADNIVLKAANPSIKELNFFVKETDFAAAVKDRLDKNQAWQYRRQLMREILVYNLLNNEKRVSWLVRDAMEATLRAILLSGKTTATISQVIHNMKLNAKHIVINGEQVEADAWKVDELRLQLLNELAVLNFIDIKVSHKTHIVSITDKYNDMVDSDFAKLMKTMAMLIQRKTILVEPAPLDTRDMISQSSWWYKTPEMSEDQIKFVETMHNLKWEFVPNALDLIEEAYKEHSKDEDGNLPRHWEKYGPDRIEEFKAQIKASFENDGHYIPGKFDSALRWYWQAEIGHTQTSPALRKLVRPCGINDAIKYDMTNSVVQMYAIGLKSKRLAKYVNLVAEDERVEDLRLQLANEMNRALGIQSFTKDNTKPLFMVWAYNAGKKRLLEGTYSTETNMFTNELIITQKVAGLREITEYKFSDDALYNTWTAILNTLVPEIVELKRVMNNVVKGNGLLETQWHLPDNAIAQYASVETLEKPLHWVTATYTRHQHTHHRKQLVIDARAAGLLPRMIHSIDAYFARQLVIRAADMGIVVVPNHDSFMFDRQYVDTIFELAKALFAEIMEGQVLFNIVKEYNKTNVSLAGDISDKIALTMEDLAQSAPMELEEL